MVLGQLEIHAYILGVLRMCWTALQRLTFVGTISGSMTEQLMCKRNCEEVICGFARVHFCAKGNWKGVTTAAKD